MWSSWNQALQARCLASASAVALMTMSLNETLPPPPPAWSPSCLLRPSRASAARSMSTSVVRKKWGMGPSDVARRLAIVLRIWVRGTSAYGAPERSGNGTRETGNVAAGAVAGARSRSFLTTRPPGPEPVTSFRSTPASFAIRRASGEAFTRVASVGGADVRARDQVHHRLVGLDLGERLPRLHRVAVALVPLGHTPLLHGGRERFHIDVGGHGISRGRARGARRRPRARARASRGARAACYRAWERRP